MADINEMRKRFYEEDGADPHGLGLGSSSSTAAAAASTSSSAGPARRSSGATPGANAASSSASASGGRPGPYPKRPSDGRGAGATRRSGGGSGSGNGGGGGGAHVKRKDLSFIERARAAPDDDDDHNHHYGGNPGFGGAGAGAMDVDVSYPGPGRALGLDLGSRLGNGTEEPESDVAQLVRAWQNERHAPDILPSADALLVRVLDAIRRQVRARSVFCLLPVCCMLFADEPPTPLSSPPFFVSFRPRIHRPPTATATLCPQSDDASALRSAAHMSEEEHYMTMLVQTEVERIKFVVRSYVRTRLFKVRPLRPPSSPPRSPRLPSISHLHTTLTPAPQIEQHAAHITSQPSLHPRLTAAELRHAQRYAALTVSQFTHTVLAHLPDAQQALDDEVITIPNMS